MTARPLAFCSLAFLIGSVTAASASPRADVVVYADHMPERTHTYWYGGAPFQNPFEWWEDANDPHTKILVEVVPGLKHPVGASSWGLATWGKYVFLGNYDTAEMGIGQDIADHQIGLFDSETKVFCPIMLAPGVNASVEWVHVADPTARQTRIYWQGISLDQPPYKSEPVFGFFEADLDAADPCTEWSQAALGHGVSSDLFNFAAAFFGIPDAPCPGGVCLFDGFSILHHDPATLIDTIVFHNWIEQRMILAKFGPTGGALSDVYPVTPWEDPGGAGCILLLPTVSPGVDRTRSPNDVRFISHFDTYCWDPDGFGPGNPQPLGPSPLLCSGTYPTTCPSLNGCLAPCKGRPIQEFRVDTTAEVPKIAPTSPRFYGGPGKSLNTLGDYASNGDMCIGEGNFDLTGPKDVNFYSKNQSGEHSYFDPDPEDQLDWETIPPDFRLEFETSPDWSGARGHSVQVGNQMYSVGKHSIQRDAFYLAAWQHDTQYKMNLGSLYLPTGAHKRCWNPFQPIGNECESTSECATDFVCKERDTLETPPADLVHGGSPASLWMSPRYKSQMLNSVKLDRYLDAYLIRVPVATNLPDNLTSVRPGVVWSSDPNCATTSCDRLWLVAEHGGALEYRVRDDGLWSGWYPLPTNIATAGGASAIVYNGKVELYSRSATGQTIWMQLDAPLDCEPTLTPEEGAPGDGLCRWSHWGSIPSAPVTDVEPAATVQDAYPFVTVRDASTGRLWFSRRQSGSIWTPWFPIGTLVTNAAPAIAYDPSSAQPRVWIVAREATTGRIAYNRVLNISPGVWWATPTSGAVEPWATGPAVLFDGTRIRIFASKVGWPNLTYQVTVQNNTWDSWAKIPSEGVSTWQPVGTVVNGDVNLYTTWFTNGIQEQLVK